MKQPFKNPYADLPDLSKSRLTIDVSTSDYQLIACIRPQTGTITGAIGLLWQKLCNELKRRNITDVSRSEDFEQFVANLHLVGDDEYRKRGLYDGSTGGPMPETDAPNDGTGTTDVCAGDTNEPAELSVVEGKRPRKEHKDVKRSKKG